MSKVYRVKYGFAEKEVQESRVVGLNDEEEEFFQRYVVQLWTYYDILRVAPDVIADEVGVPWCCRNYSDLCAG